MKHEDDENSLSQSRETKSAPSTDSATDSTDQSRDRTTDPPNVLGNPVERTAIQHGEQSPVLDHRPERESTALPESESDYWSAGSDQEDSPSIAKPPNAPLRKTRKRRLISSIVMLLLTVGGLLGVYYSLKPSNSVKINVRNRPDHRSADATSRPGKAPEDVTADAIAEVRSALANPPTPPMTSSVLPSDATSPDNTANPTDAKQPETPAAASRRNQERSIRFPDETGESQSRPTPSRALSDNGANSRAIGAQSNTMPSSLSQDSQPSGGSPVTIAYRKPIKPSFPAPALPSFGSILPVRTLGKIYTLRSGSSIRLELTRYVSGDGWSLSKGTVLLGQVRGSEQDRAFIAITGFIDPTRDRLVNAGGEVLGDDGGSGIRGKFHKLSSGWTRAFARVGSAAVNVAGAVAGGRIGGQPVVISDVGTQAVSPFSYELDSSLVQQAHGFVEVPAGTSGFVMVTTLPADEKGVDAQPGPGSHSQDTILASSGRPNTLSDDNLALLLTSGDPAQIREALPRMSPQMQRVAESLLTETSDREPAKE